MRKSNLTVLLLLGLAAGCSSVASRVSGGRVENTIGQRPERGRFVEAIGIGVADPRLQGQTQRMSLARDAAIANAQYHLLSLVQGVQIKGGITVQRAMEKDSMITARLRHILQGAEIVRSEFTSDDGCVVTMRLPKDRLAAAGVRFE
ncbi:MAG: hypothetical protein NTX64_14070 [Elusimicrobia bacterium]|nr:hypothetical protein [Elusimicrobiota bacterium]